MHMTYKRKFIRTFFENTLKRICSTVLVGMELKMTLLVGEMDGRLVGRGETPVVERVPHSGV